MNQGVALGQAYLLVNGYFTVTEYPAMGVLHSGEPFAVTDLDVLAYRFAGAGHELVHRGAGRESAYRMPLDVALRTSSVIPDMIVGEVKEGRARLNPALRQPVVMAVALARFGCCGVEEARELARELVQRGHAVSAAGHHVRTVALGGRGQAGQHGPMLVIPKPRGLVPQGVPQCRVARASSRSAQRPSPGAARAPEEEWCLHARDEGP